MVKRKAPSTAFKPGQSGNPGGQSKEKRAFLDRLRGEDAKDVYEAMMALVREGNVHAVLKAWEYIAGKAPAAEEDRAAVSTAPDPVRVAAALKALSGE